MDLAKLETVYKCSVRFVARLDRDLQNYELYIEPFISDEMWCEIPFSHRLRPAFFQGFFTCVWRTRPVLLNVFNQIQVALSRLFLILPAAHFSPFWRVLLNRSTE